MSRKLTSQVISAAIDVHRQLGPGLLESVYLRCLQIELESRNIQAQTELQLPVTYKGQIIHDLGFRMDMLVEDQVVVELKSVQRIEPVHKKQLLSYLRLSGKEIGLLINFNEVLLKDGIFRVAIVLPRLRRARAFMISPARRNHKTLFSVSSAPLATPGAGERQEKRISLTRAASGP